MTVETGDVLDIAVRVWQEPVSSDNRQPPSHSRHHSVMAKKWPDAVLVFDTETTIDQAQRLTFGSYRYGRWRSDGSVACLVEGLFHADDLPDRDPDGFRILQDAVAQTRADVVPDGRPAIRLLSRREFLDDVLWPAQQAEALICGFNLAFDLSRLAVYWTEARGRFAGGFSFVLWEYQDRETGEWREHKYRPRLRIKTIDSKRAQMAFGNPAKPEPGSRPNRGRFLDLRTLAFVLSDKSHSLRSAGDAFSATIRKEEHAEGQGEMTAEYVAYNRRDVAATVSLMEALRAEYDRHPVDLPPDRALSPASLAKAYLKTMGLVPPLQRQPDFSRSTLGASMAAYFGGRAECRIRKVPVPVVQLDVQSMYPSCQHLLGIWPFMIAERIEIEDCTEAIRQIVRQVSVDRLLQPDTWSDLGFFASVAPDGDELPVRARYSASLSIGVNPFRSDEPHWYAGPDLMASLLLTGQIPRIVEAFRLVPVGTQAGLKPTKLRGVVEIDPVHDDFSVKVIEERKRCGQRSDLDSFERNRLDKSLKVIGNSGSYGILAEQNRQELPKTKPATLTIYGLGDSFAAETATPETPGVFCFPPLASLITAGARLMLALIERLVTDAGGHYVFCDTDSMAVVSSEIGGLIACPGGPHRLANGRCAIRALAWSEVDQIVKRIDGIHPYDRFAVPESLLKVEDYNFALCGFDNHDSDCTCTKQRQQLWCYAISAKRYALFNLREDGSPLIRKASEHGLGHLLNPTDPESDDRDWITQLWEGIVREALGLPWEAPRWLSRPAISRVTASSPVPMRPFPNDVPYADAVKPFNFLLSAHVAPNGHPTGVDPQHFHLIASYSTNARQWMKRMWTDVYSGNQYSATTAGLTGADGVARVRSYRDVLELYKVRPEAKSAGPDGKPCDRETVGLLQRRPTRAGLVMGIGKESNKLDEVEAGLIHDWSEVQSVFTLGDGPDWEKSIIPVLQHSPAGWVRSQTGLALSTIKAARNGHTLPHPSNQSKMVDAAIAYARLQLGTDAPADDRSVVRVFLQAKAPK